MKFFSRLLKPAIQSRRKLDGVTVAVLLREALKPVMAGNYRHVTQKETLAVVTKEKLVQAADRAFMPWRQDVWECEDIARALVNEAQRMAANEGCSWAIGTLRGAYDATSLHVWVWAIVEDKGGHFPASRVVVYNPTARDWEDITDLKDVDYTFT